MSEKYKILVINPGSTSTKVAYFENLECVSSSSLKHNPAEIESFKKIAEQYPLRKQTVIDYIYENNIKPEQLNAVVGRGGLLKPLKGGTYHVNSDMLEDLLESRYGEHASNLGAVIAHELAEEFNIPAFIVNPVVVDELSALARYSGLSALPRKSVFHALNQKAVAIRAAKDMDRKYEDVNLIVAHLGGGISVGAHSRGRVIDVNNGLEEGPFSPERTGSLPVLQLIDLCFSGKYSREEARKLTVGKGGMVDYLGTSDCMEIEERIEKGDHKAQEVLEAMAYQVAKEIGACSSVLRGDVDSIVITGGLARSGLVVNWISDRVGFIAPVRVYPGEDELLAMAEGVYRVLSGEEYPLAY